jgi:replicative DNA helicase
MASAQPTSASSTRVERVPPHSEEAERAVLGAILLDGSRVLDLCVERQVSAESFYVPAHRQLFDVMLEMTAGSRPIDLVTVTERLTSSGQMERLGGHAFIDRLVDTTPTAAHAEYYIDIVRQKHLLRVVIEKAQEAVQLCHAPGEEADAVVDRIEQSFFGIRERQHGLVRPWADVVHEYMEQVERIYTSRRGVTGIPTGFRNLDGTLQGLHPGNMIVLAARPSMGKTSLAMNIAENVATGEGDPERQARPVGIFSLEMSCLDLVKRMICTRARLSAHMISRGDYISSENHRKLVQAADALTKAPVYLDDSAGLDITELRARARRMKKKHGIQLLVVDYLQLLHASEYTRQGRQVETTAISGGIKAMAKELMIPVLVLSQLSRAPEQRDSKSAKPKLSDLRDSGSIEQDADVVMLLRRPAMYPDDEDHADETLAIVDIAKHRNGPTNDSVKLNFERDYTLFRDRAHGVDEEGPRRYAQDENP